MDPTIRATVPKDQRPRKIESHELQNLHVFAPSQITVFSRTTAMENIAYHYMW